MEICRISELMGGTTHSSSVLDRYVPFPYTSTPVSHSKRHERAVLFIKFIPTTFMVVDCILDPKHGLTLARETAGVTRKVEGEYSGNLLEHWWKFLSFTTSIWGIVMGVTQYHDLVCLSRSSGEFATITPDAALENSQPRLSFLKSFDVQISFVPPCSDPSAGKVP